MGRTYYPGVYVVTNERLIEAAQQTHYGVLVRPLDIGEVVTVGGIVADGETRPEALVAPQTEGPLTADEIRNPRGTLTCPTCGREYKNREQHYQARPDHRPGVVAADAADAVLAQATEEPTLTEERAAPEPSTSEEPVMVGDES